MSHGVLEVADLQSASPVEKKFEDGHGQASSFTKSDSHSPIAQVVTHATDIYNKAMVAISSTFSHHVARQDDWMLLGTSTCINLASSMKESIEQSRLDTPTRQTNKIVFLSRWDETGRMTILSNLSHLVGVCTAQHIRNAYHVFDSGTPLLLSPSGIHVTNRGILTKEDDRRAIEDLSSLRARCTSYLSHQGLSVSPNADWILVEISLDQIHPSENVPDLDQPMMTLWPAEYVLCKDNREFARPQTSAASLTIEVVDPVARAETWYLGSAARARGVEAAQVEADYISGRQELQKDVSDFDVSSELATPPFRDAVLPDASGIYPTPPDGLLSQPSETPVSYAPQEPSPNFAPVDQTAGTYVGLHYHDTRNDDLFGDLDLVGEADFSFFDEPGAESEEGNGIAQRVQSAETTAQQAIDDSPSDMSGASSLKKDQNTQEILEMEIVQDENMAISVVGTSDEQALPITEGEKISTSTVPMIKAPIQSDPKRQETPAQHSPTSEGDEGVHLTRRSFNPVWPVKLELDPKYGDNGRFGHPPESVLNFGLPMLRKSHEFNQIPLIGLHQNSLSSPDSRDENEGESDTAMIDKQPSDIIAYDISEDLRRMSELFPRKWVRAVDGSVSTPASLPSPESESGNIGQGSIMEPGFPPSALFNAAMRQTARDCTLGTQASGDSLYTSKEHNFIQVAQVLADQVAREELRSLGLLET